MVAFCEKYGIAYAVCGKVIVATQQAEISRLDQLLARARANKLAVELLMPEANKNIEPHARCLKGLRIPSTAIVSYQEVCTKFSQFIEPQGGVIRLNSEVFAISEREIPPLDTRTRLSLALA